jgi:hypothetical protein
MDVNVIIDIDITGIADFVVSMAIMGIIVSNRQIMVFMGYHTYIQTSQLSRQDIKYTNVNKSKK